MIHRELGAKVPWGKHAPSLPLSSQTPSKCQALGRRDTDKKAGTEFLPPHSSWSIWPGWTISQAKQDSVESDM